MKLCFLFCFLLISCHAKECKEWAQIRRLYPREEFNQASLGPTRIPKIIHQIWLGSPFPEKYRRLQQSWIDHHPNWEYKLWTDEDVAAFGLKNQAFYDRAINWGQKSDIARYEILERFGGLYIDTDFECVKPFDILNERFDFYTGLQRDHPKSRDEKPVIANGLIGTIPGHPILKLCIEKMVLNIGADQAHHIQLTTGPFYFTEIVLSQCKNRAFRNGVFPSAYFYPLPSIDKQGILVEGERTQWLKPESFAIHYWECSWMKKN